MTEMRRTITRTQRGYLTGLIEASDALRKQQDQIFRKVARIVGESGYQDWTTDCLYNTPFASVAERINQLLAAMNCTVEGDDDA